MRHSRPALLSRWDSRCSVLAPARPDLYAQLELLERSYVMVLVAGRVDLDHDAAVELSRTRVVHARER
jgi:hypothetical protein